PRRGRLRRAATLSRSRLLLRRGWSSRLYGGEARNAHQPQSAERGHRHRGQRRGGGLPVLRHDVRGWRARAQRRGALRGARYRRDRSRRSLIPLFAMDIVVTVKQVPDPDIPPTHFKVDESAKKVIPPAGVSPVMNGYDAHALEAALRLKEQLGGKVTVVSLGGDSARDTLKRAIAMGADAAGEINEPRYPPLKGIMAAGRAQIPVWGAADLGLDAAAGKVNLRRLYVETREAHVELIEADSLTEAGARLADKLREARLV